MTPEQVDRVFGRGRLKMVTGEHVEVFREAVVSGERRRYTKRFLNSTDGDFAHWTEREWKILARLIGHGIGCVPDVVQFDRGSANGPQLVQTYDAGVTVDQWATLLPLYRDGRVFRHAFEDCAHWWALAHYCLKALKDIHELDLVHLDIKGDNVCIPFGPATFDPDVIDAPLYPLFGQLALIDFAFSLVSGESLTVALPIGWQREYDYQSPRLIEALAAGHEGDLRKTRELDWRCDFYSLAAMLKRYLPGEIATQPKGRAIGWTPERYAAARTMILSLRRHHDAELPLRIPHEPLIDTTGAMLGDAELAQSLAEGWTLARDVTVTSGVASPLTPMTRIAPPVRVFRNPREREKDAPNAATAEDNAPPVRNASGDRVASDVATPALAFAAPTDLRVARMQRGEGGIPLLVTAQGNSASAPERRVPRALPALAVVVTLALGAAVADQAFPDARKGAMADARDWFAKSPPRDGAPARPIAEATSAKPPVAGETLAKADTPQPAAGAPAVPAAPTPATSSANPAAADVTKPTPVERTETATDAVSAESNDGAAAATTATARTKSDAPLAAAPSKPSRRGAPPISEPPPRTAGKRPAASASSSPSTRPMPSAPAAPATASKPAPGRYAMSTPRGSAAGSTRYGGAASSAERPATAWTSPSSGSARVETAPAPPVHIIELAPPSQLSSAETAGAPAEKVAPANSAAVGQQDTTRSSETPPAAKSPPSRRSRPLAADEEWRAGLNALAQFFGLSKRKPAPVEDRRFQEVTPAAKPSRAPQSTIAAQDRAVTSAPRADVQALTTPPAVVSTMPRADTPPPIVSTQPSVMAPPALTTPSPSPSPAAPPIYGEPRTDLRGWERVRESDYASDARRALTQSVPRIAMQTQSEIAAVLATAARAQDPRAERDVIDAAQSVWVRDSSAALPSPSEAATARRLNEQAMQAYWVRRNIPEAFDLALKAFGANPNDPEVVGNLAFLHLRMTPSQPETARQLALHAIAVRGTKYRSGRLEDWNTYALASALTGRDIDARNAMYVTVALAGSVERNCKAGLSAIANYGERVREPVEAMMYRIHAQGRAYDSPYCAWPPSGSAVGMRRQ